MKDFYLEVISPSSRLVMYRISMKRSIQTMKNFENSMSSFAVEVARFIEKFSGISESDPTNKSGKLN